MMKDISDDVFLGFFIMVAAVFACGSIKSCIEVNIEAERSKFEMEIKRVMACYEHTEDLKDCK